MKSHTLLKSVFLSVVTVIFGLTTLAAMAGSTRITGKFSQSYSKQEALPIPQAQGHVIMLTESQGSNSSTNGSAYMDGAKVVISEIVDLDRGNGPHQGYVTQTMPNGDETVTHFDGKVTTTMTAEGQPNTTFKGNWKAIRGTGQYSGIKGSGTYVGRFTSEKDYVVDWKGYYFIQ
ncbi:MAG: hypothetical protein ACE5GZ_11200 [Gammaproteobacteria bacterium]